MASSDAPNGRICCILGGCGCPPGGGARQDALAAELEAKAGCCPSCAKKAATWSLKYFGLVPKSVEAALLGHYDPRMVKSVQSSEIPPAA